MPRQNLLLTQSRVSSTDLDLRPLCVSPFRGLSPQRVPQRHPRFFGYEDFVMDQRILIVNAARAVRLDSKCFSRQDQSVRMGGSEGSVTVRPL